MPGYLPFAKRIFQKKGDPLYLVFFITENCLARCKHCLLGERGISTDELSLKEIELISKNMGDILFLLLTGGEPFLRDDLVEIVKIFYRQNHIRNLGIPSNGYLTDKIVPYVEEILKVCSDVDCAVDISIDEIGETHNELRGLPGLFDRAVETFKRLRSLQEKYTNFNANIAITVSAFNQDRLEEVHRYFIKELKATNINNLLVRGKPRNTAAKEFSPEKYENFIKLLEQDLYKGNLKGYRKYIFSDVINAMKNLRNKTILRILKEDYPIYQCYAGLLSAVISARGDLLPCEQRPEKFGNLREVDYSFKRLWNSPKADRIRADIRQMECYCTYECFLTNSIIFNLKAYPRLFAEYLKLKYHRFFG